MYIGSETVYCRYLVLFYSSFNYSICSSVLAQKEKGGQEPGKKRRKARLNTKYPHYRQLGSDNLLLLRPFLFSPLITK